MVTKLRLNYCTAIEISILAFPIKDFLYQTLRDIQIKNFELEL